MSDEVWFCPEGHEHASHEEAIAQGCDDPVELDPEPYVDWWEGNQPD